MDHYPFLHNKKMKWSKEEGTLLLLALAYQSMKIDPLPLNQKSVALDLIKTMEHKIYNADI